MLCLRSAWLACPKNGKSGPHCLERGGSTQFAQQLEFAVTAPPLVGCVVLEPHHQPSSVVFIKLEYIRLTPNIFPDYVLATEKNPENPPLYHPTIFYVVYIYLTSTSTSTFSLEIVDGLRCELLDLFVGPIFFDGFRELCNDELHSSTFRESHCLSLKFVVNASIRSSAEGSFINNMLVMLMAVLVEEKKSGVK